MLTGAKKFTDLLDVLSYMYILHSLNGYITDVETNGQTYGQIIAVIGKKKLYKMWPTVV